MFSLFLQYFKKNSLKIYTFFSFQFKQKNSSLPFHFIIIFLFCISICNCVTISPGPDMFFSGCIMCFNLDVLVKIFIWSGISLTLLLLFLWCHRYEAIAEAAEQIKTYKLKQSIFYIFFVCLQFKGIWPNIRMVVL